MSRRGSVATYPEPIAPGVYTVRRRKQRGRVVRAILGIALAFVLVVVLLAAAFVFVLAPQFQGQVDTIPSRVRDMLSLHADPYTPLGDIAPVMTHAVVAVEDRRFYQHHGIDLEGVLRAMAVDIRDWRPAQGGSTITEQLDERVLFQGATTATRELKLLPLAWETDSRFSKPEILELYLNDVYFGRGAYGVAAASEAYFGLRPSQLHVSQAAFLAALVQAPSIYGDHPYAKAMQARWRTVVRDLFAQGYIGHTQEARALRSRVRVLPRHPLCPG